MSELSTTEAKVDSLYTAGLSERMSSVETVIKSNAERIKVLEYKSIDLEAHSRRRNFLFRGIAGDHPGENCFDKVRDFIQSKLCIETDMYLERAHRLGSRRIGRDNQFRPIIVAFRDYYDTVIILEQAHRLKGTGFGVSRDYRAEISKARKSIWSQFKEARSVQTNKVQIKHPARLVVNGQTIHDCFPDWDDVLYTSRTKVSESRIQGYSNAACSKSETVHSLFAVQPDPNKTQSRDI